MPHKIELIPEGMVRITYSGIVDLDERLRILNKVMDLGRSNSHRKILECFRQSESTLDIEQMGLAGQAIGDALAEWKAAWVIDKPADAINRFIRRIAEKHGAEIELFDSPEDAENWLSN